MPALDPGNSFGGTMELAVFGRARNEIEPRREQAQRRLEAFAAPGGPWEVKDVSQTGFRLLAPMSVANAVTLGTLVAIRPHGQHVWVLGIVRRMRRLTADRAEIGLQVIANALSSVDLIEQRKAQDDDYSVDGEATTINGRIFQGLFLSLRKRESDPAVQSLIMPAVEYQPARRFALQRGRRSTRSSSAGCSSSRPEWVWTAVEPVERAGTTAGAPSAADLAPHGGRPLRGDPRGVPLGRAGATFPSRRRAAAAGRTTARASRCYWEDESGAPRRSHVLGPASSRRTGCRTRSAALGVGRGDKVALILPQRPETVVAHIAIYQLGARRRAAVVPVRSRGARVPAARLGGEGRVRRSAVAAEPRRDPRALPRHRARHRRRRRARVVDHAVRERCSTTRRRTSRRVATRGGRSRAPRLHERHHRPAEGRADAAAVPARQPAGVRPLARRLSRATGDLFWSPADWAWTGGLMDALLPALYFGQPIVGYRGRFDPERAFALIEKYGVRNTFLFPTALKMMMKAFPRPSERFDRRPAHDHERRRSGRHDGVRMGARGARRHDQRDVRPDRDELHRRQLARAVAGEAGLDGPSVSGAPDRGRSTTTAARWPTGEIGEVAVNRIAPDGSPTRSSSSSTSGIRKARRRNSPATGAAPAISRKRDADGYLWYQGRADDMFKAAGLPDRTVRDRELPRPAPGGGQRRGGPVARRDARQRRQGVHRARGRACAVARRSRTTSGSTCASSSRPTSTRRRSSSSTRCR